MNDSTGAQQRIDKLDLVLTGISDFTDWWSTGTRASRAMSIGILAILAELGVLGVWAILSAVGWIVRGLAHAAAGVGQHASAWPVTHVISDPVQRALAAADLPANTGTLLVLWAAACVVCWIGSLFGVRGARIGWAVVGAATAALAYVGTPEPGRLVAALTTAAAWSMLSIPAYWQHCGSRRQVIVVKHDVSRDHG